MVLVIKKRSPYFVDWFIEWLLIFFFKENCTAGHGGLWGLQLLVLDSFIMFADYEAELDSVCCTEGTSRSELKLKRPCVKLPLCQFIPPCYNFPKINLIWQNTENNGKSSVVKLVKKKLSGYKVMLEWYEKSFKRQLVVNLFIYKTRKRVHLDPTQSSYFLFICFFASELFTSLLCSGNIMIWS